jgi:hypothetical protein
MGVDVALADKAVPGDQEDGTGGIEESVKAGEIRQKQRP